MRGDLANSIRMLENRPVEFCGSSGEHLAAMSFCLSNKILEYVNGLLQVGFLQFGVGGGWKRGLERGWGRVGEGLAFYGSKKNPCARPHNVP